MSVDALEKSISVVSQQNIFSNFKESSRWKNILDGFSSVILDLIIIIDNLCIPNDKLCAIAEGISQGTTSVVSNGLFLKESPIVLSETSAVIVATAKNYEQNLCATGKNWVNGPTESQLSYRSEISAIIAALTIIDVIFQRNNITDGSVTIALESTMEQRKSTAPMITDQKSFEYLQIIQNWIQLSPLTLKFRHVSSNQTDYALYDNLDWWEKMN